MQQGTSGPGRVEPGKVERGRGEVWRHWFLSPPYPGWMLLCIVVLSFVVTATLLAGSQMRQPASGQVAQVPPPVIVTPPATAPEEPADAPVVMIRPMPERQPTSPANGPAAAPTVIPGNSPATAPAPPPTPLPGAGTTVPGSPPFALEPEIQAAPVETPRAEAPRVEAPVAPAPELEPVRPDPPRVESPRPRPQPRVPPVRVPAYDTGRLAIFFDADSSTFDRNDERLPLRVQVYVDGEMRVDNDDPEKREFDLGNLREGRHEIVVIPYVGKATPTPRRYRVDIDPDRTNRFKAVLRREEGAATISKFRSND